MKGFSSIGTRLTTVGIVRSAAAALVLLAASSAGAQSTHTVAPGETLDAIGRKYKVAATSIASENGLSNPNLIRPGDVLKIPSSPDAPKSYEVKNGDTLGSIAQNFGTTVTGLTDLNAIKDPKLLQAGQVILIPPPSAGTGGAQAVSYPLPSGLQRDLDRIRVNRSKWKYVVIHHSAMKKGTLQGMDMYHRQIRKMENGLAYHFVIGNGNGMPDGKIEIGNRWKRQIMGGHLASSAQNETAIGICLVGNFETDRPSQTQMKSLYALVSYLRRTCNIPRSKVQTHRQINSKPTACPGKLFPVSTLMNNI